MSKKRTAVADGPDAVDEILSQWHQERPDLDPTPMAVFGRLARNRQIAAKRLERMLKGLGLTPSAFDVLANLRRSGFRKTASQLAESSMLTSGGITFRLDRLEADGVVRRVPSPDDRRVVFVELTEKGRGVIDEAIEAHLELERALLHELSAAEVEQLAGLLRRLEHSLRTAPSPETIPEDSPRVSRKLGV